VLSTPNQVPGAVFGEVSAAWQRGHFEPRILGRCHRTRGGMSAAPINQCDECNKCDKRNKCNKRNKHDRSNHTVGPPRSRLGPRCRCCTPSTYRERSRSTTANLLDDSQSMARYESAALGWLSRSMLCQAASRPESRPHCTGAAIGGCGGLVRQPSIEGRDARPASAGARTQQRRASSCGGIGSRRWTCRAASLCSEVPGSIHDQTLKGAGLTSHYIDCCCGTIG
jgi:hypothetical protein